MKKWVRRGILAASVIALVIGLALVVAAVWLVPRPEVQNWIGSQVAHAAGSGIEFESASLAFWPALGIRLHEVRFEEEGQEDEKGAVATIGSLSCTLRRDALLEGKFVLARIFVEQPVLSLERAADGDWILGGSLPQIVGHSRKVEEKDALPPSVSAYPKAMFIIRDGHLDLKGQRPDGTKASFHIRHLDVDFRLPRGDDQGFLTIATDTPEGGELSVDATLQSSKPVTSPETYSIDAKVKGHELRAAGQLLYLLTGLPIRMLNGVQNVEGRVFIDAKGGVKGQATVHVPTGSVTGWGIRLSTPARLEASFDVTDGKFSMHNANLQAPGAGVGKFSSGHTAAWFDWSPPRLEIKRIDLEAYGGSVQGAGSASFVGQHTFSVDMQASDLDFKELVAALGENKPKDGFETLSASAKVQGVWTGPETWLNTLKGTAKVNLADGEMTSSRLIRAILRATIGLIPGYSHIEREPVPATLERLDLSCTIHDAKCFTEDFVFISSAYHVTGDGSIGFDTSVDLNTRVVMTEGGMAMIYGLVSVPFRRNASPTFTPVPVKITGPLSNPTFIPDVSGVSMAPIRVVLGVGRGAVGVGRGAFDVGKGVVGFGTKITRKVGGVFRLGRKRSPETQEKIDEAE